MRVQVMWRFLEQKSFPLTPTEYMQQLDAVAEYLTEWGCGDTWVLFSAVHGFMLLCSSALGIGGFQGRSAEG